MPMSAEKALEGMLAEGVDPAAIISKLEAEGFSIKPPEGDESYEGGEEAPVVEAFLMEGESPEPEVEEGGEESETEEAPEPIGGDQKPLSLMQRRQAAAKAAIEKHYPSEKPEDED